MSDLLLPGDDDHDGAGVVPQALVDRLHDDEHLLGRARRQQQACGVAQRGQQRGPHQRVGREKLGKDQVGNTGVSNLLNHSSGGKHPNGRGFRRNLLPRASPKPSCASHVLMDQRNVPNP